MKEELIRTLTEKTKQLEEQISSTERVLSELKDMHKATKKALESIEKVGAPHDGQH